MKNKMSVCISFPTLFAVVALLFCNALSAQAETWNLPADGTWNDPLSWNPASIPDASGANATFNSVISLSNPAQTSDRVITLNAGVTVGSINFNNNDPVNHFNNTITGASLTFDETGAGPAAITANIVSSAVANNTISSPIVLNDSLAANVNSAGASFGSLSLNGAVSGAGGFSRSGDGLVTFTNGGKSYTGPTVLTGGRTDISQAASPTGSSSFTVNTGTQLTLTGTGTYALGNGTLFLNGVGASLGPFARFLGAMRNNRGENIVITVINNIVLQSDTLIHVQANGGGTTDMPLGRIDLTGPISGPGRLTLGALSRDTDQGFLVLHGYNTYTGGTSVTAGWLVASGALATFGTGDVTVDDTASPSSLARLRIESGVLDAIADTATLTLQGGNQVDGFAQGYVDLGNGVNEVVGKLVLGGVTQPNGTYGSTSSSATTKNDTFFRGPGIVTVGPVVPTEPPMLTVKFNSPNIVIAWPTNFAGFTLQDTATLSSPITWNNVTAPVVVSGTNNTVTINASSGTAFFRLRK